MLSGTAYRLRQRYWGRWKLRPGSPAAAPLNTVGAELPFYRALFSEACARLGRSIEPREVWDIGCRNWSYAPALAECFPRARLVGVEADAGRRYWNLYRRGDAALAQAAALTKAGKEARCIFSDFRELDLPAEIEPGTRPLFCLIYPFVSEDPCRAWGLPTDFADFSALLKHAVLCAGAILSVHQGEWEAQLAQEAYRALGIEVRESIYAQQDFPPGWPGRHDAHLFVTQVSPRGVAAD